MQAHDPELVLRFGMALLGRTPIPHDRVRQAGDDAVPARIEQPQMVLRFAIAPFCDFRQLAKGARVILLGVGGERGAQIAGPCAASRLCHRRHIRVHASPRPCPATRRSRHTSAGSGCRYGCPRPRSCPGSGETRRGRFADRHWSIRSGPCNTARWAGCRRPR